MKCRQNTGPEEENEQDHSIYQKMLGWKCSFENIFQLGKKPVLLWGERFTTGSVPAQLTSSELIAIKFYLILEVLGPQLLAGGPLGLLDFRFQKLL